MQKSDELKELIGTVFTELTKLDLVLTRSIIMIYDLATKDSTWWMANSEAPSDPIGLLVQYHEHPTYLTYLKAWQEKVLKWKYLLEGKIKNDWDDFLFTETGLKALPDFVIAGMKAPDKVYLNSSFNSFGSLTLATLNPLSDDHFNIMLRFAKVFDLTYTRFNDLQKAETQAREAKIEASLERVRSTAMAMHSSEDIAATIAKFYHELESFSITPRRCGVGLLNKETRIAELSTMNTTEQGNSIELIGTLKMEGHPVLEGVFDNWLSQTEYHPVLRGNEIKDYYQLLRPQMSFPDYPHDVVQYGYFFFFTEGGVYAWTDKELGEDELTIYRRFTSVLSLTYRRYKDLKEAEAQAREATIEAALEKVRGMAMAMHASNDLSSTASAVFTELRKLGIKPQACGVGLLESESRRAQLYSASSSPDGDSLSLIGWVMLTGHPVLEKSYDMWLRKEDYFPVLSGEELKSYYEHLLLGLPVPSVPDWQAGEKEYGHFIPFSEGCLYAWSNEPFNDAEIKILKRFASIIDLAFRRYVELQKLEANTREAVRRAALDRVRAETASMRTTADLERITPLIWNELTILGVPFIRCGVFIMDEDQKQVHTFLSAPNGKAIAAFHLPYNSTETVTQVISSWRKKEMYREQWDEATFIEWTKSLIEKGAISAREQYATEHAPSNLNLHFIPFLQGMLYVGTEKLLNDEELHLVQVLADAFSTAYARYEDFNKLEAAKGQIEKALADLKQTQALLVQSEKMASLGELTAGIAHEIQNPLNFVNNFSEVNTELITELNDAADKGNLQEVKSIANDIRENEQKINHHGKKADAIVKGML
ncbi:MAG TPA: hypothetical protein VFN95_11270, partial [Flavitalea sp.]|nr:hypothetical protein [Flavitalea sp.]